MKEAMTIDQFLKQQHTPQSATAYSFIISHFLRMNPKAHRYQYANIIEYMSQLAGQFPNANTRTKMLSAIKRYYDYLIWTGKREDHPCKGLTIKTGYKNVIQIQDLFTPEELGQLLKRENRYRHLDTRNRVLISLLISQGLASEELSKLTCADVNLDTATLSVKNSNRYNRRTIPLEAGQILLFERYLNVNRPELVRCTTHCLLVSKLGRPISVDGINSVIEPLQSLFPCKNLNPKTIRMSVIANWINYKKLLLEHVQYLAGHKWPSATEKYFREDFDKQRKLINQFFPF